MIWIYRIALYALLFGVSSLTYGGNSLSELLDKAVNGIALLGIPALVLFYLDYPRLYKIVAWLLFAGVILLILESKYEYNQFVYSYFVIKRFAYCGLALSAYYVVQRAEPLKLQYAILIIFGLYLINQIFLGQIFSYALTSETRSVTAPEALYLVLPFLYYLALYLKERSVVDLVKALFTFAFIVFLLHRSVISAAVIAVVIVFGLMAIGKIASSSLPVGRTLIMLTVLVVVAAPFTGLLPDTKLKAFVENLGGIFAPKEDETGSWRVEQSTYYLSQIPERPLFGWRYTGYDRGEIMDNEEFPDKGTFIHSQYVDQLYNYGAFGLGINLLLIIGTLITTYRRNRSFTTEQVVLFSFVASGLIYGISYQLPVYYWGFVGVCMYYGLRRPTSHFSISDQPEETDGHEALQTLILPKNHSVL